MQELRQPELARAYVPFQEESVIYPPDEVLKKGTIYSELYKPYCEPAKLGVKCSFKPSSLLEELTILDFMAVDLGLYLDTHPEDTEAIKQYNVVVSNADKIRTQYEKQHGPLCSFRSGSNSSMFTWIDCPWPWEESANFSVRGEC